MQTFELTHRNKYMEITLQKEDPYNNGKERVTGMIKTKKNGYSQRVKIEEAYNYTHGYKTVSFSKRDGLSKTMERELTPKLLKMMEEVK